LILSSSEVMQNGKRPSVRFYPESLNREWLMENGHLYAFIPKA